MFWIHWILILVSEDGIDSSLVHGTYVFECPHDGCSATFLTYKNLQYHVLTGQHKISPERLTLRDYVIGLFKRELEGIQSSRSISVVSEAVTDLSSTSYDGTDWLGKGWALRKKKEPVRYSPSVKKYLEDLLKAAIRDKIRADPKNVELNMQNKKLPNDKYRFLPTERLNWRQIQAYFSRLLQKWKTPRQKRQQMEDSAITDVGFDDIEGDEELEFYKAEDTVYEEDQFLLEIYKQRHALFDDADNPLIEDEDGQKKQPITYTMSYS